MVAHESWGLVAGFESHIFHQSFLYYHPPPSVSTARNVQHFVVQETGRAIRGCNSIGRVPAFQAGCCESEPRQPLQS